MIGGIGNLQSGSGIGAIESRVRQIETMLAQFQKTVPGAAATPLAGMTANASPTQKTLSPQPAASFKTHLQPAPANTNTANSFSSIESVQKALNADVPQLPSLDSVMGLSSIEPTPKQAEISIPNLIESLSKQYSVDSQLINAIVKQESGFNPNAVSASGAKGLMQLMPQTAASLGVKDSTDPKQNLDGGIRYLKQLLSTFNGNVPLALAAYNAGPNAVNKHDGIPPYPETQRYVRNILSSYLASKNSPA